MSNDFDRERMTHLVSASGRTAAAVKLLVESSLRMEAAKRELDLPLATIDGASAEDFFELPSDPAEIEEIAVRYAIWAGAGHYQHLLSKEDAALVEEGLRALLRPIGEGR